MIRTAILDLGNVIVGFDFKRAYAQLETLCGCAAAEIPTRIRSTDLVRRFETGQVAPEQFVKDLSAILDLRTTYDEFCDLWTSVFLPEPLISESLLVRLAGRHRLMILSNTNPIHFHMIRDRYPLMRHFDRYVLSYQVGALKPSARIYEEAIAQAGCKAGECFFTDDIELNVEAAKQLGIDAIRFQSEAQLEDELRARGML